VEKRVITQHDINKSLAWQQQPSTQSTPATPLQQQLRKSKNGLPTAATATG
jgi:hypothetical protein